MYVNVELARSHYKTSEMIVKSLYKALIKGLRQKPGVWLPQSQMSSRFNNKLNKIKTPDRGHLWKELVETPQGRGQRVVKVFI